MRSRLAGIVSERTGVDLIAAALGAWLLAAHRPKAGLYLTPADHRSALYSVLAEAGLGLLGLVAAALSIVKGVGSGRRIERLRLQHGPEITHIMISGLVGIGLAAAVGIWAQIADVKRGQPSQVVVYAVYAALFLASLRLARLIWVVRLILAVEDADTKDERRRRRRPPLRMRSDEERKAS